MPKITVAEHHIMVNKLIKDPQQIIDESTPDMVNALHMAVGIAGEAGELLDAIKKFAIYNKPVDRDNLVEELGDLEFYMEGLRQIFHISRHETIQSNIDKLGKRYENFNYSNAAAQARADKQEG